MPGNDTPCEIISSGVFCFFCTSSPLHAAGLMAIGFGSSSAVLIADGAIAMFPKDYQRNRSVTSLRLLLEVLKIQRYCIDVKSL